MSITKSELRSILYAKFDASLLSRIQVAKELNKSVATIDRWRKKGLYLEYTKRGDAKNSPIEYPIDSVVDYILMYKIKVA